MGCRALAHKRRTRSSVSSPDSVVRSMQAIARRSHAACHSFFTVRLATCDCVRRSTALVLTRTSSIQFKSSGMPELATSRRPFSDAMESMDPRTGALTWVSEALASWCESLSLDIAAAFYSHDPRGAGQALSCNCTAGGVATRVRPPPSDVVKTHNFRQGFTMAHDS